MLTIKIKELIFALCSLVFRRLFDTNKHNISKTNIHHVINTNSHSPPSSRPYAQPDK